MASERLQIIIDATFNGKRGIEQAGRELKKLDQEATRASEGSRYMSQQYKQMAQNVVGYAGAAAAGVAVAWKTIGAGAELELARDRYDNLAVSIGADSDDMLEAMTKASGGMVSQAQLIASAGRIISLGLGDTQSEVVDLASLVAQLGWDMQQVIMTFANNSKMRLDSLGLSVSDVEERAKRLESQGYSMDEAFDLAVIEAGKAKLALLGSEADTTSGAMKRIAVVFEDAKNAVLGFIAMRSEGAIVGAANVIDSVSGALDEIKSAYESGMITQAEYRKGVLDLTTIYSDNHATLQKARAGQDAMNTVTAYYIGMGKMAAQVAQDEADAVESLGWSLDMVNANYTGLNQGGFNRFSSTLQEQAEEAARAKEVTESYAWSLEGVRKNYQGLWQSGFSEFAEDLNDIGDAAKAAGAAFEDYFVTALEGGASTDALNEQLFDQITAMSDNAVVTASAAYALGLYDETQLEAALNAAIINEKITQLAEAFVNGEVTARQMKGELEAIVNGSPYTSEVEVLTDEAIAGIDKVKSKLDGIPRNITSKITVITEDHKPGGGAGAGGASDGGGGRGAGGSTGGTPPGGYAPQNNYATGTGGWMTVPPGFPNDSYMVGMQSGERFNVVAAGQSGGGGDITISFAGAAFYGTSEEMAGQMVTMVADQLGRL